MGDVVEFRRRRKRLPRPPRRRFRFSFRHIPWPPLFALIAVAAIAVVLSWPQTSAVPASGAFAYCGRGFAGDCVVDGDTIRYRGVRIRIMDIDTPEIFSPKCAGELALGRRAAERLLVWINEGPFEIVARDGRDTDRHGRKLRILRRNDRSVGDVLVAEGMARYWDGRRRSWCG